MGATVYAAFLAWALRHQFTRILLHHRSLQAAVDRSWPMPPPLNPEAAQEDWPTFCAEGVGLQQYVADNKGWQWVDEGSNACAGCHKYGYLNQCSRQQPHLESQQQCVAGTGCQGRCQGHALALTFLKSYSDVGKVRVECVAGCQCVAKVFDGKNTRPTSRAAHGASWRLAPGLNAC